MGRRSRRRGDSRLSAPTAEHGDDAQGRLALRTVLSPASRREYAEILHGGLNQEDAWQRAAEFLFEHLAARWVVDGVTYERQDEVLGRYRMASAEERRWVRAVLGKHCAEHFPELEAP